MTIEQGAALTQEDSSEKLIAEGYAYLVESGRAAVRDGAFRTVVVELTYQGGDATEIAMTTRETRRQAKSAR